MAIQRGKTMRRKQMIIAALIAVTMATTTQANEFVIEGYSAPWCSACTLYKSRPNARMVQWVDITKTPVDGIRTLPSFRLKMKNKHGRYVPVKRGKSRLNGVVATELIQWETAAVDPGQFVKEIGRQKMLRGRSKTKTKTKTTTSPPTAPTTRLVPITKQVTVPPPNPMHSTRYGTYNVLTYNVPGCNCRMCRDLENLKQQYLRRVRQWQINKTRAVTVYQRQTIAPPPLVELNVIESATQQPTPPDVITFAIGLARLTADDVLYEPGCGDARAVIEAVKRSGCRGIGVEINERLAKLAQSNVDKAGLSARIRIIHGDALEFCPIDHDVTAAFVYLYPQLLKKLAAKLAPIERVVAPFHAIPGLKMEQFGDVWLSMNPRSIN